MIRPAPYLLLLLLAPMTVAAQPIADAVRLVDATTVPETPAFGEPAMVHLALVAAPGYLLFMPDSLGRATETAGMGRGGWRASLGPSDSVRVTGHYPVIGYRAGMFELPVLQIGVVTRAPGDSGPPVLPMAEAPATLDALLALVTVPLGSVGIAEYAPVADPDSGSVLAPRPPADVVGGRWSIWILLAVGVASAAGAGGIASLVPRWWRDRGAHLFAGFRGHAPKQTALRELDRVRALGWHRDGRTDDFYAAATDAVRQFVAGIDPECSGALTTSELLDRLERRNADDRLRRVAGVFAAGEQAKFGTLRPDADAAEADWTVLRDWVRATPDR